MKKSERTSKKIESLQREINLLWSFLANNDPLLLQLAFIYRDKREREALKERGDD
jgi:hypothetical protein